MSRRIDLSNGSWSHIYRFIAYHLFSSVGFTSAIWILYLQHRGYSLTEIGIGEAAFHLAPILLEVPSGSFADMIGRRWSLVVSSVLVALSSALFLGATTFPVVLLAMFLSGASMSFRSGADQAFLFDALTEDQQTRYGRVFGRLLSTGYVLSGATMWLGAWFSDIDYAIPYTLSMVFALISIVLALGLKEPPRERSHHGASGFLNHLRDVRTLLQERPVVAFMLVTAAFYWVGVTIAELYVQALFSDRGMSNAQIGAFLGVMFLAIAGGTAVGGQLTGRLAWHWPLLTVATGVGVITLGVANAMAVIVGAFIVAEFVSGIAETRMSAWYNGQLPSGQRATVLSVESWLFSVLMIGLFPLAGWFAERAGWTAMYIVVGSVMIATGAAALVLRQKEAYPAASPAIAD
jgi:MFS family permease